MPISPMDMLKYVISEQTRAKSHMTPEQTAEFSGLRNILDPNSQVYNPVSRYGAQLMTEEGKQINYWKSPLNILGVTFHKDYLAEGASKPELNMLKEIGKSPIAARGEIAADSMALENPSFRRDIIPHEVTHKALEALRPGLSNSLEEYMVRQLMIQDGIEVKEQQKFLKDEKYRDDDAFIEAIKDWIRDIAKDAESRLQKKGKK